MRDVFPNIWQACGHYQRDLISKKQPDVARAGEDAQDHPTHAADTKFYAVERNILGSTGNTGGWRMRSPAAGSKQKQDTLCPRGTA